MRNDTGDGWHSASKLPTLIAMTAIMPYTEQHGSPTPPRTCSQLVRLVICWLPIYWLTIVAASAQASSPLHLKLGGSPDSIAYARLLLGGALEAIGQHVTIEEVADNDNIPMTRLEVMLKEGNISVLILGRTAERDRKFLQVPVGMTANLVNQRILFISKGSQPDYDPVRSLEDFRQLGKIAAMGEAWADQAVWESNDLPLASISGDWRRLYRMVASASRGLDYLPRGVHEMSEEWRLHPELDVERNLVFVYEQDHILYVSPTQPELHQLLHEAMLAARDAGLIQRLAEEHYAQVFKPPVSLQKRHPIHLRSAAP